MSVQLDLLFSFLVTHLLAHRPMRLSPSPRQTLPLVLHYFRSTDLRLASLPPPTPLHLHSLTHDPRTPVESL
jgi:hypothetical protein